MEPLADTSLLAAAVAGGMVLAQTLKKMATAVSDAVKSRRNSDPDAPYSGPERRRPMLTVDYGPALARLQEQHEAIVRQQGEIAQQLVDSHHHLEAVARLLESIDRRGERSDAALVRLEAAQGKSQDTLNEVVLRQAQAAGR